MPRIAWPPHQTIEPLCAIHAGRAGVVMGGGPSLTDGMANAPRDAIYISANDHGARWLADRPADGRQCSYVMACDKIEPRARGDVRIGSNNKPWGVPVIGRYMWVDYRILFMPGRLTGISAAWMLRYMGCSPIIVLGMDFYDGGTYFDDSKARSCGKNQSGKTHLGYWHKMVGAYPAMYRAIGCHPLLRERLGVYDAKEKVDPPWPRESLQRQMEVRRVRITRTATIRQREFHMGEVLDVSPSEAQELFRTAKAVPINRAA